MIRSEGDDCRSSFVSRERQFQIDQYPQVHLYEVHFQRGAFRSSLASELRLECPSDIHAASTKRQAEFIAGRFSARELLLRMGVGGVPVGVGEGRSPVWPARWIGSITHTDDIAVCALASADDLAFLGVDLEIWIRRSVAQQIKRTVVRADEDASASGCGFPFHQALTVIFSAKESLFKAIFPDVKQYFDFDAARLISLDRNSLSILLELRYDLSERFRAGMRFRCAFRVTPYGVLTLLGHGAPDTVG